jgi:hypothetical protein
MGDVIPISGSDTRLDQLSYRLLELKEVLQTTNYNNSSFKFHNLSAH